MFDDVLPFGDPLRHIDPRYEPLDPIFDLEEPDLPPATSLKRRRGAAMRKPEPKPKAME